MTENLSKAEKLKDYDLEIGSGSFIPGFEEQLIGMKNDEEKEVEVNFPEEYHAAELAGKPAVFEVKINEIKSKEIPELNDELAKEIDEEVESLDAFRAKLKEKTIEEKKLHLKQHFAMTLSKQQRIIRKSIFLK